MKTKKIIIFVGFIILIFSVSAFCQNSKVDWYSFNMGFASSTGSNTMVKSVVGQSFIGTAMQGNNIIESGFLADTIFRGVMVAVRDVDGLPTSYELYQNYPNPFNPSTAIRFDIPHRSFVDLTVYNLLGQQVASIIKEEKDPGRYTIVWRGTNDDGLSVTSGIYFYRLRTDEFTQTKKFMMVK
jgi:hypothetical protein